MVRISEVLVSIVSRNVSRDSPSLFNQNDVCTPGIIDMRYSYILVGKVLSVGLYQGDSLPHALVGHPLWHTVKVPDAYTDSRKDGLSRDSGW